jgi:hypothetical protein
VRVSDDGVPVTDTGISARLLWNRDLSGSSGGYVTMSPVTGADTLTFSTPIPRQALATAAVTFGVELSRNGMIIDSRNFEALVEPSVLQATGEVPDDLAEFKQAIAAIGTATTQANEAASNANTAASSATIAATQANTAATQANTARDAANTAAGTANAAASAAQDATSNATAATTQAQSAASDATAAADAANAAAQAKAATATVLGTVKPGNGLSVRADGTIDIRTPTYYTTGALNDFTSPSTPCYITGPQIGLVYDDGQ